MFGFMHSLGSCLAFWFSTIIEEAMDGYTKKMRDTKYEIASHIIPNHVVEYKHMCQNRTSLESVESWPYLYPFSIEYNIILASVFYIMWTNIGNNNCEWELQHILEEIETDQSTGQQAVNYRSNVMITADCHASNLGLFSGLMSLLVVLVSAIVFFSTVSNERFHDFGVEIYTFQFSVLTISLSIAILLAGIKLRRLNVSKHLDGAASSMDDFLLILPLPFFFIYHVMCINSNLQSWHVNHLVLAGLHLVDLFQVVLQTLVLIDGIRRCSNDRKARFYKPAKGLVTFAIITNVAYWLLGTFEMKTVDKYHTMSKFYGKFEWMVVLDSCLPLMLFYRFHSSVCLSDIWKNAYEKDETHH